MPSTDNSGLVPTQALSHNQMFPDPGSLGWMDSTNIGYNYANPLGSLTHGDIDFPDLSVIDNMDILNSPSAQSRPEYAPSDMWNL